MSEKIGQFELVTELAKSAFATVYKATDTNTQQTVALKVVRLESVKDRPALLKAVFDEAERAKPLSSHNIAGLYGVGDENELLLASAEYVQGNSVATTLARHEGFSIWDLQDIARQVCQGLDHAHVHKVVHQSLEPAKIMVQWDGLVKVLGFGMSGINAGVSTSDQLPEVMHYASPERLRGEACDHRSAIFSLGAILYEMAAEQKAFPGETVEQVRTAILDSTPPLPHRVKPKVNPALSTIIMKALAKSADERYQSGQELVRDLEQCKSSTSVGSAEAPKPAPTKPAQQSAKANAAAATAGAAKPAIPSTRPAFASAAPAAEEKPAFNVDPLMANDSAATATPTKSFSDVSELPPLREVRIVEPTSSAEVEEPAPELPVVTPAKVEPTKPRLQVGKVAQRAVREIRNTPPKLYLYAVSCAVFVIALYLAGMTFYNYFEDRETNGHYSAAEPGPAPQPKVAPSQNPAAPAPEAQGGNSSQTEEAEESEPASSSAASAPRTRERRKGRAAAPAVVPAQLTINSVPAGADISFDGSILCQSPCTLTGIAPGQHMISAAKSGFASAGRAVQLNSGGSETVSLQLNQLTAILSVASTPAGAAIVIDGKDSGKLTPSQIVLDKAGTHAITIRRYGYLEASSSVNAELGQTSSLNLQLTKLGNTDEIRGAGGKFKKVFGRGDAAGLGVVSVKTQPKGAQIMVNNRVLDKTAPFDFYLNPGTYVIDITMSGYRPLHRVVNIQEGERLAIEESLVPE